MCVYIYKSKGYTQVNGGRRQLNLPRVMVLQYSSRDIHVDQDVYVNSCTISLVHKLVKDKCMAV